MKSETRGPRASPIPAAKQARHVAEHLQATTAALMRWDNEGGNVLPTSHALLINDAQPPTPSTVEEIVRLRARATALKNLVVVLRAQAGATNEEGRKHNK